MIPLAVNKELNIIQDICKNLSDMAVHVKRETALKGSKDLQDLKSMTNALKDEDEMTILGMETMMSIIAIGLRRQLLRDRYISRITDEKELALVLQNHREEFSQYIWKRRAQSKKDLTNLFQSCSNMVSRFGDIISETCLDSIYSLEKRNKARICRDGIQFNFLDHDDGAAIFSNKIFLIAPIQGKLIRVSPNRLEYEITDIRYAMPNQKWATVYASDGIASSRFLSKQLVRDVVIQTLQQVKLANNDDFSFSYLHTLAKIFDLVHPSQKVQSMIMAYPINAVSILKKRLVAFGYHPMHNEDPSLLDNTQTAEYLRQINRKLDKEMRAYFEFTVPHRMAWRIGFCISPSSYSLDEQSVFPGQITNTLGIGSDGNVYFEGSSKSYISAPHNDSHGVRTWGIVVDLYYGTIAFVIDGKPQTIAFGLGAHHFDLETQKKQKQFILQNQLYPMISLFITEHFKSNNPESRPNIKMNFGDRLFSYSTHAISLNQSLQGFTNKELGKIFEDDKDKVAKDEYEKMQMAVEKNFMRNTMYSEGKRSFSQFPPSVYRRSFACTRIQRAWRRYKGRMLRKAILEEMKKAAIVIQRCMRSKLRRLRKVKNAAAYSIQRAWRVKSFIRKAYLRLVYRKSLRELHHNASIIQKKWKHWHVYRNSPIAARYNRPIEFLNETVQKIINWWRPLHEKRQEFERNFRTHKAATDIQRVWRGYYLRQLLRPDLRIKLRTVGEAVAKHKDKLYELHGAYVLQNAWRSVQAKRVRADKMKTRNLAAARIQALWKGFWTRSRTFLSRQIISNLLDIALRFSYGQTVFLNAVCKGLKNAHFILKIYKPCGIVCPKETSTE